MIQKTCYQYSLVYYTLALFFLGCIYSCLFVEKPLSRQTLCPVLSRAHQTSPAIACVVCSVHQFKKKCWVRFFFLLFCMFPVVHKHTALGLLCFLRNAIPLRSTSVAHSSQLDQPGLYSRAHCWISLDCTPCCWCSCSSILLLFSPSCFAF